VFEAKDEVKEFEVESILAHKVTKRKLYFLVKWKHYDLFEASWEPECNLENALDILNSYKLSHGL
jgi:Chromo (CHRromatin Organisation MOdifier) domain